jgi:hypothetical protein
MRSVRVCPPSVSRRAAATRLARAACGSGPSAFVAGVLVGAGEIGFDGAYVCGGAMGCPPAGATAGTPGAETAPMSGVAGAG